MKTKRCFNYFTIADFENEERWLNAMSRRRVAFRLDQRPDLSLRAGAAGRVHLQDRARGGRRRPAPCRLREFPCRVRRRGGGTLQGVDLPAAPCGGGAHRDGGQQARAVVADKSRERIRCRHIMPFVMCIRRVERRGAGGCCAVARGQRRGRCSGQLRHIGGRNGPGDAGTGLYAVDTPPAPPCRTARTRDVGTRIARGEVMDGEMLPSGK